MAITNEQARIIREVKADLREALTLCREAQEIVRVLRGAQAPARPTLRSVPNG
jgi:hypothetical protein